MVHYLLRRLFSALLTILLAAALVFSALLMVPGDPAVAMLGINASPETLSALRQQLGLDEPPLQRFLAWLWAILHGDFGRSLTYRLPVGELIAARLEVSIPLALGAMLLACLLAIPLGLVAALRQGGLLDLSISTLSQLGAAVPSFWLGLLFILLFSVNLGWLPAGGYVPWERDPLGYLKSLTLPVLALALGQAAIITRMTRATLLDVLALDYVRTARAKGLPQRIVITRHTLRNAMISLITIIGLSLAQLLIGSIVIEQVFALPGLGQLVLNAIGSRDFPLLQGEILLYAAMIVVANLVVDISYSLLDPRIRYN